MKCELVYVVGSRRDVRDWVSRQPSGIRYFSVHNKACATGISPVGPERRFVVLPSADVLALFELRRSGFKVDLPKVEPLEKFREEPPKLEPEGEMRDRMRRWHWTQHFRALEEGDSKKATYHRNLAKAISQKTEALRGTKNLIMESEKTNP